MKEPRVAVLPLVDGDPPVGNRRSQWKNGWCTYSSDFEGLPDVEFFCGGINTKTPTAAGLWRQGNLMHFGFEQSPAEMNKIGRGLLVNAIVYISRFTEDRPIARTPSVFANRQIPRSRGYARNTIHKPERDLRWVSYYVNTDVVARAAAEGWDRAKWIQWYDANEDWMGPDSEGKAAVDEHAKALDIAFATTELFEKGIPLLRSTNEKTASARDLLARYSPSGPGRAASVEEWSKWWNANRPYLFFSEAGRYQWYIDPLAKKRGVPSKELRGAARADSK